MPHRPHGSSGLLAAGPGSGGRRPSETASAANANLQLTAQSSPSPSPSASRQSPPSSSPAPYPSLAPASAASSTQPERRRSSFSLFRKLSHSHHSHSHSLSPSAHSHSVPLLQVDQQQQQPVLTTTTTTTTESHSRSKDKPAVANMLLSFAKKLKLSDKDKDKSSKDSRQHLTRSASMSGQDSFHHSSPPHDGIHHQPNTLPAAAEIDLSLLPMPATAADPGPPPPIATFNDLPQPDMDDSDADELDFESTLDINISTLTSSLSTALLRLSAFTQPLVCDRDLDLPDECRLASTLAHHLVATYLPSKHLPHFTPLPAHAPALAVRPKDAATYLTSILARHFLTKLAQSMPRHASDAATRAAAREVTYHFLRADALGAMHVPLPPFWAGVIADVCDWVESTLAEQFAFSDTLFTADDRERVHHAARACALATAMMRVVHPQLSYAWVRPGVTVSSDEVREPIEEWVGERPVAGGSSGVRVAYCVFPKVDESETGLDEAGIWKAVVVGYAESDPATAAGFVQQHHHQQQQQQRQHSPPTVQPMSTQGLPPRTSSKAPAPSPSAAHQEQSSAPRSLPLPPVVAQQQLAQPPTAAAVVYHPSVKHLDSHALPVPPTVPQHPQQQQHHAPEAVAYHQPADVLPVYYTLDQLAPPPTSTTSAPVDEHEHEHDDGDQPAPENPLTFAYPDDDSDNDQDVRGRGRDQAVVMSALNQDFVVQTSLDAASAAAAAAAAADGDAGAGYQAFDYEFGAMQSR